MTGFARVAGTIGASSWAWEIRTVNGRGLDVRTRVPPGFESAGEEVRRQVAGALARGQCQLGLTVSRPSASGRARLNRDLLGRLLREIEDLPEAGRVGPVTLDGLLAIRGVVEIDEEDDEGEDALKAAVAAAGPRLAADLQATRTDEGRALAAAIEGQVARIAALTAAADAYPGRRPEAVRARLAAQVEALVGASALLDPGRLHQEAALLATRADIREELDRLAAHVAAARELMGADGPVGRRLDFLAQEFGREANTLCAKAGDVELSRIGLDLKGVVEQFREQVQNVE